jgi:carbon-monoxide dehydrogenase medium subunit
MYPDEFDLLEPDSVEEALDLLADHDPFDTELLAGGHSLLPTMKTGLASPDTVVDISGIDALDGIEADGDTVAIGATTTYATVTDDERVRSGAPALAAAAGAVGDRQVRNAGTVGGNLAHADPAADLPGAAIAADATVVVAGQDGERRVDAEEFFLGMYETDVGEAELLTAVEVPRAADAVGAYAKRASDSSGYAVVGVAAQLAVEDGVVADARVAANGVTHHGVRLPGVEDALADERAEEDAFAAAAAEAVGDVDEAMLMTDREASADYREQLLEVYTERALQEAAADARAPAAGD